LIAEDLRADGRGLADWLTRSPELFFRAQPFSEQFRARAVRVDAAGGVVRLKYDVPAQYCNFRGQVHGGVSAALLDDAAGIVAALLVGTGFRGTAGSSISYLAPVSVGEVIVESRVIKHTRQLIFAETSLFSGDELCARSSSTMLYGALNRVDFDVPANERVRA
jgi:acyl-coenzyme A thioesterase 13